MGRHPKGWKPPVEPDTELIPQATIIEQGATPDPHAEDAAALNNLRNEASGTATPQDNTRRRDRKPYKKRTATPPVQDAIPPGRAYSGIATVAVSLLDALCTRMLDGPPLHESEKVMEDASIKAYLETLTEEDLKSAPGIMLLASTALIVLPRLMDYLEKKKAAQTETKAAA